MKKEYLFGLMICLVVAFASCNDKPAAKTAPKTAQNSIIAEQNRVREEVKKEYKANLIKLARDVEEEIDYYEKKYK